MPKVEQAKNLPYKLALRTLTDDVWYSNALPEWYTPEQIDGSRRAKHLMAKTVGYLGTQKPMPALPVQIPRVTAGTRRWVVPAVNDQMIMQACVSSLAPEVARGFDKKRVYSFVPSEEADRVEFMSPQIVALTQFQADTAARLEHGGYALEFDIEKAFANIDRAAFYQFLDKLKPDSVEVELIRCLLDTWSGSDPGIPLVNDSVFFLGSAYLRVVDDVLAKLTGNYIRYMDDYRVFGTAADELERLFERISQGVASIGLKINPRKVRIASKKDYEPMPKPAFAHQPDVEPEWPDYVTALDTRIDRQIEPQQVVALVKQSLARPAAYLNEGVGRYLMGTLRRYRLNYAIHRRAGRQAEALGASLRELLRGDQQAVALTGTRLVEYGKDPANAWRAIWVIYLIEQQGTAKQFDAPLKEVEENATMPSEVKLWARRCRLGAEGEPKRLDDSMHDLSYIDAGKRCYGVHVCTGEGFSASQ